MSAIWEQLTFTEFKNTHLKINAWLLKKIHLGITKKIKDHSPEVTTGIFFFNCIFSITLYHLIPSSPSTPTTTPSSTTLLSMSMSPFPGIFFFILERGEEGEKERERIINVREKHRSVVSCTCPDWGTNLQPRHVPWLGIKPTSLASTQQFQIYFFPTGHILNNFYVLIITLVLNL